MRAKFFFKHGMLFLLFFLFFNNSCTRDNFSIKNADPVQSRDETCNFVDQYKHFGIQFYEYLKYDFAYVDALKLLPEEHRSIFATKFDSLRNVYAGWDIPTLLNHLQAQGTISSHFNQAASELNSLTADVFAGIPDFPSAILDVQNLAAAKTQDASIPCNDKRLIIAYYSIAENLLLYMYERYGEEAEYQRGNNVQSRDCGFWKRLGCFFETVFLDALTGFGTGVNLSGSAILDIAAGIGGFLVGAAIGVVHGIFVAFDGDACCPDDIDCFAVLGVSLNFTDCNPMAEYYTWGFGPDAVSLGWANSGGTPATAITPSSSPKLTITQTAQNTPVSTGISTLCSNGTLRVPPTPFIRDLFVLSKDIYGVGLWGPTTIPYGWTENPYTYYASGVLPPRYEVVSWNVVNGTIIQSDLYSAEVLWDDNYTQGEIQMTVRNVCPNGTYKSFILQVEIGSDIN